MADLKLFCIMRVLEKVAISKSNLVKFQARHSFNSTYDSLNFRTIFSF